MREVLAVPAVAGHYRWGVQDTDRGETAGVGPGGRSDIFMLDELGPGVECRSARRSLSLGGTIAVETGAAAA